MTESLTTKVTEQGVVIPREWFAGVEEVEIRRENGRVVVDPRVPMNSPKTKRSVEDDPIWNLGKNPIDLDGPTDVSVNHDRYIYGEQL